MGKTHKNLTPHPLGSIFPMMDDEQYKALKESIKSNGFDKKHPVVLFEGQILDGNNRHTAAKAVKVEAEYREFNPATEGDPIEFVIRENLSRRHLTPSQSAMAGAELAAVMEKKEADAEAAAKAANEKTASLQSKGKGGSKKGSKTAPKKVNKVKAAAKVVGASPRNVAKAKALLKDDPKAADAVKGGKETLHGATVKAEVKKSAAQRASDEFSDACKKLDEIIEPGWTKTSAIKNLNSKEIIKMAGLDTEEIKRIKPYIESGWALKAALGFKSTQLTMAHTIRQLTDRAIGEITPEVGEFKLLVGDFSIIVRKQTEEEKKFSK